MSNVRTAGDPRPSARRERLKGLLRQLPGFAVLRFVVRCLRSARSRREALFELSRPDGVFQPYATTWPDRYPGIFRFVREEIGDGPHIRILSFGCASGEEVFSLRRHFAEAEIVGIDANPYNIAACRRTARRQGGSGLVFRTACSVAAEPDMGYDAIFCMAVLRHGQLTPSDSRCDHLLRFADFARTVGDFARCLRPGGLLAIRHSNFRFCDSAIADGFDVALRVAGDQAAPAVPLFGPDDRRLAVPAYDEVVFRKLPADPPQPPSI